jgi:hypothetical protein
VAAECWKTAVTTPARVVARLGSLVTWRASATKESAVLEAQASATRTPAQRAKTKPNRVVEVASVEFRRAETVLAGAAWTHGTLKAARRELREARAAAMMQASEKEGNGSEK